MNNEDLAKQLRLFSNQLYELSEKLDPSYSLQLKILDRVYLWAKAEYCTNGKNSILEKHLRTKLLQAGMEPRFLESAFNAMIQCKYIELKDGTYPNRHFAPILERI